MIFPTQLRAVESKIAGLNALRQELASLIRPRVRGTVADCRILEALGPQGATHRG